MLPHPVDAARSSSYSTSWQYCTHVATFSLKGQPHLDFVTYSLQVSSQLKDPSSSGSSDWLFSSKGPLNAEASCHSDFGCLLSLSFYFLPLSYLHTGLSKLTANTILSSELQTDRFTCFLNTLSNLTHPK